MQEPFDFDEWKNVYETDLPEYEFRRKLVIDDMINNAPERVRASLRNLQARLDAIHMTCTPEQGLAKMFAMMTERVGITVDKYRELAESVTQVLEDSKQGA